MKYIFCTILVLGSFLGVIYPVEFGFGEENIYMSTNNFPEQDYYLKTRIPIVFYSWNQRNFLYEMFKNNYERENLEEPENSEYFHRNKCSIKSFHYLREIALSLNKNTLLKWDNCYTLELDKKRLLLDGKENLVQTLEKERIDIWKKYIEDEIEIYNELPIPEILPKLIPEELISDAKTYHNYLLVYLYNGIYSGLVMQEITRKYAEPYHINNRKYILNFNQYVYDEKISPEEKKNLIKKTLKFLKRDIFLYQYHMMQVSVLRFFPEKTQKSENINVLEKIKKSTNLLNLHLEKFKIEKDQLNRTVECLENWSPWHKENLRMAYYYNFFYDYGNPSNYSIELLADPEYGKIVKFLEEKRYKSKIFQKRLEIMMNDVCSTKEKSVELIELTYKAKKVE